MSFGLPIRALIVECVFLAADRPATPTDSQSTQMKVFRSLAAWLALRAAPAVTCSLLAVVCPLAAQQVDYHRADFIRIASNYVAGMGAYPSWLEDSVQFWYTSPNAADRGTVYL